MVSKRDYCCFLASWGFGKMAMGLGVGACEVVLSVCFEVVLRAMFAMVEMWSCID